jgi:hypothetical protein
MSRAQSYPLKFNPTSPTSRRDLRTSSTVTDCANEQTTEINEVMANRESSDHLCQNCILIRKRRWIIRVVEELIQCALRARAVNFIRDQL